MLLHQNPSLTQVCHITALLHVKTICNKWSLMHVWATLRAFLLCSLLACPPNALHRHLQLGVHGKTCHRDQIAEHLQRPRARHNAHQWNGTLNGSVHLQQPVFAWTKFHQSTAPVTQTRAPCVPQRRTTQRQCSSSSPPPARRSNVAQLLVKV